MTDLLDYKVDSLNCNVFDAADPTRWSTMNAVTPSTNKDKEGNYLDIISLISNLTTPTEIDYQFTADFFLVYRSFISQRTLLRLLLLRIRWCLKGIDDEAHEQRQNTGKLTLVRTFVVIRHWLMNYFTEDYLSSEELRDLFVQEINGLRHEELFVQRVVGSLKKTWTECCNKSWNEKVESADYYHLDLKIGPQSTRNKRLSVMALSQQNDPVTRNSMMLSTYDMNVVHKLPIPLPSLAQTRKPNIFLNPKNSNLRLSIIAQRSLESPSITAPPFPSSSRSPTSPVSPRSPSDPLYIPLLSVLHPKTRNIIKDDRRFPKNSTLTKVLPPTPVKKMELVVPLPPPTKPQPKGLKPLIEHWMKTFHLHTNNKAKLQTTPYVEKFMQSVVSVAKPTSEELEKLALGKFDILCARTIDEVEYLVRFHNEIISRHSSIAGHEDIRNTFDFTLPGSKEVLKAGSNIDNMNICETISNISKSVISLQQLMESETRSCKSYISYDSMYSTQNRARNLHLSNAEAALKKRGGKDNLRDFNFENSEATPSPDYNISQDADDERFEFESNEGQDDRTLDTFPTSILSESTPDHHDQRRSIENAAQDTHMVVAGSPYSSANPSVDSFHDSQEEQSMLSQSQSVHSQVSDYDDIDSFVSTYEEPDDDETNVPEIDTSGPNHSDAIVADNEPSTPTHDEGLISSTPQISPIKAINEDHHQMVYQKLESHGSFPPAVPSTGSLNLNRVPSFKRISNTSISTASHSQIGHEDKRLSHLYQRSVKVHRVSSSDDSIFSDKRSNSLVKVNDGHEQDVSEKSDDDGLVTGITGMITPRQSNASNATDTPEYTVQTIDSEDFQVPYPGVDSDAIAELAAISDESYQADPINAALQKLEGQYKKSKRKGETTQRTSTPASGSSVDTAELSKQVENLSIRTPIKGKRESAVIHQRRKTKLFALTPVQQKEIKFDESGSRILLELLLSHKITSEILQVSNSEHHVSFILNFDSKTLAEQLTLIEKDALLEIDWKELVELKWESEKLVPINSWLELLVQNQDIQGVDLCVSRFNLTVNWIISEVLLTKDIQLRKLTIQRFIHVAQHCKTLQNFSTLMQILLALGSDKVMKLKETWRIVEPGDILIFKNLESISSPLKNFMNLRIELNKIKPSLGCVPFLGLYLSDLIFNKEKRSVQGELINFGKFKHTSKIVRSLIQCIQWSTLYRMEYNDEVLSKCLYIKALTEEEMNTCLSQIS
ncbi:Guanine nucleotide exchange factor LTE1 [Cyberlindnera fabianii]|uniref:Guanine nucleotide exchange factor LTE1 n=1 Tax=Cyberlindnera fabianii TaxID=36022 RepID=A0A1V2L6G2_CYBFA|nr:Guanine nucleotide exchange factor LTE1 [Cyberlindnera fabianii]